MSLRFVATLAKGIATNFSRDIFSSNLAKSATNSHCRPSIMFGNTTPVCLAGTASSLSQSQIVSYEEVKALPRHPEKILVDVREPEELAATGVIPTSINIPSKTLEDNLKLSREEFFEKFGRDKPTVNTEMIFHCKGGGRAGKATELAVSLGFQNSKSYKGSWLDWSKREGLGE